METHQQLTPSGRGWSNSSDGIDARVTLITGPAGYGKTTAARQWVARQDGAVWYQADASSRDIATLALSLARALSVTAEGISRIHALQHRWSERGAVDGEIVQSVAEALSLRPGTASVLVIDDYDLVESSPAAATLMGSLVAVLDLRMVIIARRRPSWATPRRVVYREIHEIDRGDLAFTEHETAALLVDHTPETVRPPWSRTQGWPAALRLAALAHAQALPENSFTVSLYEYFAEELYAELSQPLRTALGHLARLPSIDDPVLRIAMGGRVDPLRREALASGFISEPEVGKYDLHPLLRDFLIHKTGGDLIGTQHRACHTAHRRRALG